MRGRATFSRPFERVEALRRKADDRLRGKALELQAELQQTETKLTELQSKRNDQSSLMLSPEQEAELKRFIAEKARVRKELRETQRGLDVDINRLDSWLKVINIVLAPLCVAVAGVVILSLRRRRRTAAVERIMSRQRFIVLLVAAADCDLRRAVLERAAQSSARLSRQRAAAHPGGRAEHRYRLERAPRRHCRDVASSMMADGPSPSAATIPPMCRNCANCCWP